MEHSDLTIRTITARAVLAPFARPISTAYGAIEAAPLVLIDVACSQGVTGRAYIFGYTAVSLNPLIGIIKNLAAMLAGKKVVPRKLKKDMDTAFALLGRQGLLGMAMAGLDMAFWDALGKAANMAVATMLGGSLEPAACYDSHGVFNAKTSPKELEQSLKDGFKAIKFKFGSGGLDEDTGAAKAVRDVIGPDILLMADYNQTLSAPEAIRRIARLAPFDLHWIEEPVAAEDFAGHIAVRAQSDVAIQTGENWWFAVDAARAVAAGICDHAMLDIMKIGGVAGWLQAAAICDGAALPVSSHLFIEASAHVMAVTPGAHLLEHLDAASAILAEPYVISDGTLAPRGPGLGMEWDETAVEKYAF